MSIRAILLFCIFTVLTLFVAAVGWASARGMDSFQRDLVRIFHMELLNEGSAEFLAAARQFHMLYENLPAGQRTENPSRDLAPFLPQEDVGRYLFLDSRGLPIGESQVTPELLPLLEPGVLESFWSDAVNGGARDFSTDNFVNYIEGKAQAPAMLQLRAYPEQNLMVGMGRLQEITDIRLESFSELTTAAYETLIRRAVGVYAGLILLALILVGLTLQYLFFSPLSKYMTTMATDGTGPTHHRLTWERFKEYARRLQHLDGEKNTMRTKLEREIEARFQAESERDALRSNMERTLNISKLDLQKQAEQALGDLQAALLQRESRVLSMQLLPGLERALQSLPEGADTTATREALARCLVTVCALGDSGAFAPLELRETELQPWLEGIATAFAASRSVPVESHIRSDVRAHIEPDALRQAVEYVMDNAAIASRNGAGIRLDSVRENDTVEIRIIDSGPGIAEESRPYLFVPFFSLTSDSNGLGLAVTRSVVERHGGAIEIHTESDKGTAFIIRLPAL